MSAGLLRTIKSRIKSVDNTKKITRAMEMVSAAKLRRFQTIMSEAMPYTEALEKMLLQLAADQNKGGDNASGYSHPFFETREGLQEAVVVVSSDSGLCGPYNTNIIEQARKYLDAQESQPILLGVGKSAIKALESNGRTFHKTFIDLKADKVEPTIKTLRNELESLYMDGKVGKVHFLYTHYASASSQKAITESVLPLQQPETDDETSAEGLTSYIYEPSPEFLFDKLIPSFFESKVRMLLLESFVSEYMARMQAMNQATKSASDMIDDLTLTRNKIRQAIITKEIIEIISGSKSAKE